MFFVFSVVFGKNHATFFCVCQKCIGKLCSIFSIISQWFWFQINVFFRNIYYVVIMFLGIYYHLFNFPILN